jgi:hypothetical protein
MEAKDSISELSTNSRACRCGNVNSKNRES